MISFYNCSGLDFLFTSGVSCMTGFWPLVYTWKSSADNSVTEGEESFLGLFSFGTCGVVVCAIMVKGDYCSVSSRVLTSHSVWFTYFSISGLSV
jgi:hypothetical protein